MKKERGSQKPSGDSVIQIKPLNMRAIIIGIQGTAPLCINRFSQKAIEKIQATQTAGSTSRGKKERTAKDFKELYETAKYISEDGWLGFAASSIRNGAISACRTVGFKMTFAKLAIFVEADGADRTDGTPLIRITDGEPEMWIASVRNQTGVVDLRARPLWRQWGAKLRIRYDADIFTEEDVVNLIARVGAQVGIGEGRPDSKNSAGIGLGTFRLIN